MEARINHGRWVVDCLACPNAEYAWPGTELVQCSNCGQFIEVQHPANWLAIERVLASRKPDNQNWYPGETVQHLRAENLEHGVIG